MHPLMYDRGRGPELRSCRITVYDLIPYLRHPADFPDERLTSLWGITLEELAALKQHVADHYDEVMAENARIEERVRWECEAQRAAPEYRREWWTSERSRLYRVWLPTDVEPCGNGLSGPERFRARIERFREWMSARMPAGVGG